MNTELCIPYTIPTLNNNPFRNCASMCFVKSIRNMLQFKLYNQSRILSFLQLRNRLSCLTYEIIHQLTIDPNTARSLSVTIKLETITLLPIYHYEMVIYVN